MSVAVYWEDEVEVLARPVEVEEAAVQPAAPAAPVRSVEVDEAPVASVAFPVEAEPEDVHVEVDEAPVAPVAFPVEAEPEDDDDLEYDVDDDSEADDEDEPYVELPEPEHAVAPSHPSAATYSTSTALVPVSLAPRRSRRVPLRRIASLVLLGAIGAAGWFVGRPALGDFLDQRTINAYADGSAGGQVGESDFVADFPRRPERSALTVPGTDDTLAFIESRVGDTSFSVAYVDVARNVDDDRSTLMRLARSAASAAESTLAGWDNVSVKGDPALDYRINTIDGDYVKARIILHKQQAYIIQSVGTTPDVPGHGRLIQSFRFV